MLLLLLLLLLLFYEVLFFVSFCRRRRLLEKRRGGRTFSVRGSVLAGVCRVPPPLLLKKLPKDDSFARSNIRSKKRIPLFPSRWGRGRRFLFGSRRRSFCGGFLFCFVFTAVRMVMLFFSLFLNAFWKLFLLFPKQGTRRNGIRAERGGKRSHARRRCPTHRMHNGDGWRRRRMHGKNIFFMFGNGRCDRRGRGGGTHQRNGGHYTS